MAVGDLSAAQAEYAGRLAAATGLDRRVAIAWIGAESGWGITRPGHNYLNVGPGRTYPSVAEAAAAAARLVNTSGLYAGIRQAIGRGPRAQLDAIVRSPWDAGRYEATIGPDGQVTSLLHRVYDQLTGGGGVISVQLPGADEFLPGGDLNPVTPGFPLTPLIPDSLQGRAGSALGRLLGVTGAGEEAMVVALTVLFTAAALGMLLLAAWRISEPVRRELGGLAATAVTRGAA